MDMDYNTLIENGIEVFSVKKLMHSQLRQINCTLLKKYYILVPKLVDGEIRKLKIFVFHPYRMV